MVYIKSTIDNQKCFAKSTHSPSIPTNRPNPPTSRLHNAPFSWTSAVGCIHRISQPTTRSRIMMNINGIGSSAVSQTGLSPTSAPSADSVQQFNHAMSGQGSQCSGAQGASGQSGQSGSTSSEQSDTMSQMMEMIMQVLQSMIEQMQGADSSSTGDQSSGQQQASNQSATCGA